MNAPPVVPVSMDALAAALAERDRLRQVARDAVRKANNIKREWDVARQEARDAPMDPGEVLVGNVVLQKKALREMLEWLDSPECR